MIVSIIAVLFGSGSIALYVAKEMAEHRKKKITNNEKDIDNRADTWKIVSEGQKAEIKAVKEQLEMYDRDMFLLLQYIAVLTALIAGSIGADNIPPRPVLEREKKQPQGGKK